MSTLQECLQSSYNLRGSYDLRQVSLEGDEAVAEIDLATGRFATPSDVHGLFTYELTFALVSQVGIAYAHLENGQERKTHEVWMKWFEARTVHDCATHRGPLRVALRCSRRAFRRCEGGGLKRASYTFEYALGDGFLTGATELAFTFPVGAGEGMPPPSPRRTLQREAVAPLLSPYLSQHMDEDILVLDEFQVNGVESSGRFSMRNWYRSPTDEGRFHLSGGKSFELLCRAGLAHLLSLGGARVCRPSEMRESMRLEFRRPVTGTQDLPFRLRLLDGARPSYRWRVEIEDGAFTGELSMRIPDNGAPLQP